MKRQTCRNHVGHIELNPCDVPVAILLMNEYNKNIANICAQMKMNHSSIAVMLNVHNELNINLKWRSSRIYHYSDHDQTVQNNFTPNANSALSLVEFLISIVMV